MAEMGSLLVEAAALQRHLRSHAAGGGLEERGRVFEIISRLHGHVLAEAAEEEAASARESHTWAIQHRGRSWTELNEGDCLTLDAALRSGSSTVRLTLASGDRAEINLRTMQGKVLGRSSSKVKVRATALPRAEAPMSSTRKTGPDPVGPTEDGLCNICFSAAPVATTACGHCSCCQDCLGHHIRIRVRDGEVLPWIPCPAIGCFVPLAPQDLVAAAAPATAETSDEAVVGMDVDAAAGFTLHDLMHFPLVFLSKQLVRLPEWAPCTGPGNFCPGGFLVASEIEGSTLPCPVCETRQAVRRRKEEVDEHLESMIQDGTIRSCPKCEFLTMKEFGICNVINCEQCGIWWNWRTRNTGRSSAELKNKARQGGSLWEPGELAFQRNLQQSDPSAFKDLLERNGIRYDPSYRRGT